MNKKPVLMDGLLVGLGVQGRRSSLRADESGVRDLRFVHSLLDVAVVWKPGHFPAHVSICRRFEGEVVLAGL